MPLKIVVCFITLLSTSSWGQNIDTISFWKPSDSLNTKRLTTVLVGEAVATSVAFIGLNELWYKGYPKSKFHLINDGLEWNQMDKFGHGYSAYHLSRVGSDLLQWSGVSKNKQLVYGAGLGFLLVSSVEVLDGFSEEWGASPFDLGANLIGSGLYVTQELLWDEQRIVPKFSFHRTTYATIRPNVLGSSIPQQVLKDYNGQIYWLSFNLQSILSYDKIPSWLNLAIGYGAEGMVTANPELVNTVFFPDKKRTRQFYMSLDVDLTKIKTKSALLKTFFNNINMIKIPAPTLEINNYGKLAWHALYF